MRVDSRQPIGAAGTTAARSARAGRGFSISEQSSPVKSSSIAASTGTLGLDAVLALQGESETPQERRKRAAKRGHQLLDALDQLKLSVLSGHVSGSQLASLRRTLGDVRTQTDDPRLDDLLGHIELRAEVELAKLARPPVR